MTERPSAALSWSLVDIRPTIEANGSSAVALRFSTGGDAYTLSLDEAESAAWRLLGAARLAQTGIGGDDPEKAN